MNRHLMCWMLVTLSLAAAVIVLSATPGEAHFQVVLPSRDVVPAADVPAEKWLGYDPERRARAHCLLRALRN